jgi:hypothetical protein
MGCLLDLPSQAQFNIVLKLVSYKNKKIGEHGNKKTNVKPIRVAGQQLGGLENSRLRYRWFHIMPLLNSLSNLLVVL